MDRIKGVWFHEGDITRSGRERIITDAVVCTVELPTASTKPMVIR
jgi:hypothetical protein